MRTDEELMGAYVAGDEGAFGELFERYAPVLLRLMRRGLPEHAEAQDLVQKTFLQLHRARLDFRQGSALRPWLMTIALNLKREYLRSLKRGNQNEQKLRSHTKTSVHYSRPDPLERAEEAQKVRAALAALPASQREVIELHWFEGLSFPEVSQIVGATLSAVKVRAHRGYKRLKGLLEPPGRAGEGQS